MKTIWELLCEKNNITELAKQIVKKHEIVSNQSNIIKSLENERNSLLKASNNLIAAIEQGIITEQTKTRLKELETQISQLDFDIEQEKQRSYTFLTQEKIESYLQSIIRGDIENINIRKTIIKIFIREIILYNDKIVIMFNFTDQNIITSLKPKLENDNKELEEYLNQYYTTCSSANNVSFPPHT